MKFSDLKNATNVLNEAIADYESKKAENESLKAELSEIKQTISKSGYKIEQTAEGVFELVEDETSTQPIGDYLNPIPYTDGMKVENGKWYSNDEGYIWECIKDGTPTDFGDKEYFDIVGR